MPAPIPIGEDDFQLLRERGLEYVDKSRLIQHLIDDSGARVLLLPRPRRFGKTINLTMLEAFFARDRQDRSHLFEGLHIWRAGPAFREHFQRYPTLFITFKNIRPASLETWEESIRGLVSLLYARHRSLLDSAVLTPEERRDFEAVLNRTPSSFVLQQSLLRLTEWLHRATGEPVVVLVDEYDTPIHVAWTSGCYQPVIDFLRAFFGAALKGNPHLFKAVLTGILRVSKESIFSDLNNLLVRSLLDTEYSDCFGFTEDEVGDLFARHGQMQHLEEVRLWYNGYRFGARTIYNPWSVLNFLRQPEKRLESYWLNSSSNDLIRHLLTRFALRDHAPFQTLLEGGAVERRIQPHLAFPQLEHSSDALFSLLLFSGYLKAEPAGRADADGEPLYRLSVPNREVAHIYRATFQQWIEAGFLGYGEDVQRTVRALLEGDEATLEDLLQQFTLNLLSVHDRPKTYPEALYHGLLLGLCAVLEPGYRVRSNRESGLGRPDVLLLPSRPGQPGAVLELKVARRGRKTLEQALAEGLAQLEQRKYATEVETAGAVPVHRWVLAFDGKEVRVRYGGREG